MRRTEVFRLALLGFCAVLALSQEVVQTTKGPVRGEVNARANFRVFRGIPYAQSTAGANRWAPPQPMSPWTEVRDATKFQPACPQNIKPAVGMSEDCLFLNVWTPLNATQRPVMVWIHGGGFLTGSGSETINFGDFLANSTQTILVAINYRLGALGYLAVKAHGQTILQGNYGHMDQQAALRWVRDNIAAFGGDPKQVTVFGQSAGGMSAFLHLVTPDSFGLYSRVIIHSDPFGIRYRTALQDLDFAQAFSDSVQCAVTDLDCLRAVPMQRVLDMQAVPEYLKIIKLPLRSTMIMPWQPSIDSFILPDQPMTLLEKGKFNKVPTILGTTKNETRFILDIPITDVMYELFLNLTFQKNASQVLAMYPKTGDSSGSSFFAFFTDYLFGCSTRKAAALMSKFNPNVYHYHFLHSPLHDPVNPSRCSGNNAACHTCDIPYVFNTQSFLHANFTPAEAALSKSIQTYWTSFAAGKWGDRERNGSHKNTDSAAAQRFDASASNAVGADPTWPAYDDSDGARRSLALDTPVAVIPQFRKPFCDFWDAYGYHM